MITSELYNKLRQSIINNINSSKCNFTGNYVSTSTTYDTSDTSDNSDDELVNDNYSENKSNDSNVEY